MSLTIDSSNRVTGMASGMDTDTIIEGLLSTYQQRLDKQSQTIDKLEWKADAYRETNTLIKNFRSKYLSVLSDTNMMSTAAYSNYKVNMQTATSAVTISASSSAVAGSYTINSITQLAQAAKTSSQDVFTGTSYQSDTMLNDLALTNKFTFDENGQLSFSINGKALTFSQNDSIADMIRGVNTSGAGVTMRYSSLTKGFSITSNTTGEGGSFTIENLSGNAFAAENSALGIAQGSYLGKDAIGEIEGIAIKQSSNTFTYDGVTYTLNAESPDTPIEFTVEADYQSTVDRITEFIDAYNELVGALQSKMGEEVYYDYDPLTDEQKEKMSEDEIEKWQEKAKSGALHNDTYISSLLSSLRNAFYSSVGGTGKSMYSIGLTTGAYADGAKITVDKDKLLMALKENPDDVKSMFIQTSSDSEEAQGGVMTRISNTLLNYTQNTTDIALDSLETRVADAEETKEGIQTKMEDKQEALWQKFSDMETALSKLNSLSSWLASLFTS